jgi:hypothetical protein
VSRDTTILLAILALCALAVGFVLACLQNPKSYLCGRK